MRVGLVVAANKYTGAAAVAVLCCRALRAAAIDARLLFVGGRNLERRLDGHTWAAPALTKERTPFRVAANLGAVTTLASDTDIVVCHLPHDHFLCVAAGAHRRVPMVRAIRNPGHLHQDPYHRFLDRRLSATLLAYSALRPQLDDPVTSLPSLVCPVPVEDRFRPADGTEWRRRLAIPADAPVIGMVGKMARGRGFDLLLEIASRTDPAPHVLAVGHGEARTDLEKLSIALGIGERVRWAGYHDEALPALYAAMDVVLFPCPGSDWGHRAISEAQACARPVVAAAVRGVEDLVEDGFTGLIAGRDPGSLSAATSSLLYDPQSAHRLGSAASTAAEDRRLTPVGRMLAEFLEGIATHPPRNGANSQPT